MFSNRYGGLRVLVTGHTGFKGSWLCAWLNILGAEVTGFSAYTPSSPSNFEVLELTTAVTHVPGDIRDSDQLKRVFRDRQPEIVFHLAAQPLVRRSVDEPKVTFDTNVGGTVNVLEAIRETRSVRAAVMITSDKCYDNVEWEYGYRETDRLGGRDPYSASKACAEIVFSAYWHSLFSSDGPLISTCRAGNVIGGGDWATDRMVPDCVRAWAKRRPVSIRNPNSTRPWQHVLEPLSGYLWLGALLLSGDKRVAGKAYNFGPDAGESRSVMCLVQEMARHWTGTSWSVEPDVPSCSRHSEAGLLRLCCDRALADLKWHPVLSFAETVELTAEWYREYYEAVCQMREITDRQIELYVSKASTSGLLWSVRT